MSARCHRMFMLRMNFAAITELATTLTVRCARLLNASGGARYFLPRSRASVWIVDGSARPSTRAGRKWRWNAVTTLRVLSS